MEKQMKLFMSGKKNDKKFKGRKKNKKNIIFEQQNVLLEE